MLIIFQELAQSIEAGRTLSVEELHQAHVIGKSLHELFEPELNTPHNINFSCDALQVPPGHEFVPSNLKHLRRVNFAVLRQFNQDPRHLKSQVVTTAHQCSSCGWWIRGLPTARNWVHLPTTIGNIGEEYFCRICDTHLGTVPVTSPSQEHDPERYRI